MARVAAAQSTVCANIALCKYWGKADTVNNLPAVPSLSITLDGLVTNTRIVLDDALEQDQARLSGETVTGKPLLRISTMLDRFRQRTGSNVYAVVESENSFPTAAGLASSASGFAALATAANEAFGASLNQGELSAWARRASASAARSLFGGYVELLAGSESASQVAEAAHFPLRLLVVVTRRGAKDTGSTEAMERTRLTSPYYGPWVEHAPKLFEQGKRAVHERDLAALGAAMEQSTLLMHASMFGAVPPVIYFEPATLSVIARVRELRASGIPAYFTMDAGPHVKVLLEPGSEAVVHQALLDVPGVVEVRACGLGPGPRTQTIPLAET